MYLCWCNKPIHKSTKSFPPRFKKFNNTFFFQRELHAKRSFCWPKATNVLLYKCCKAANVLSSRVIEPYFIYTVGLRGWRDCYDRCCTVSENAWFLERCCSLHQLWENISTLGNWDFFFSYAPAWRLHWNWKLCMYGTNKQKKKERWRGVF